MDYKLELVDKLHKCECQEEIDGDLLLLMIMKEMDQTMDVELKLIIIKLHPV